MQSDNKQFSELISAFESSPLAFAILNSELHIVYTNKVLSERYPDLQNPVKLYYLFKDIDKPTVLGYLNSERSYEFSCDLPDQMGAKITLNALFSDDGKFNGAAALISPKVEAAYIIPSKEQSKSHMAVNREFRERLNMMFTSIFAISQAKDFEPSPKICEYINHINQNCYQLFRASDNIERILRLSSPGDKAFFKLVDFADFLSELVDAIIRLDNKKRVPIEFVSGCGYLPARIDHSRMEFAITNIILNSIKYTRDGNKIKITLNRVGNNAVVSISDKGAGIPKDVLSKIGTPYYSYSHGENFDTGFGIGLYIAKKYIASHAGIFSIQSEEGVGTTVTISIPLDIEKKDGAVGEITFERPPEYDFNARFSIVRTQLSEIFYYPEI